MGFMDLFQDLCASVSFTELHAEAPPEIEPKQADVVDQRGGNEEGGEDENKEEGGDDEEGKEGVAGEDAGEEGGEEEESEAEEEGEEGEEEQDEEEEPEDPKPKIEEGMWTVFVDQLV